MSAVGKQSIFLVASLKAVENMRSILCKSRSRTVLSAALYLTFARVDLLATKILLAGDTEA